MQPAKMREVREAVLKPGMLDVREQALLVDKLFSCIRLIDCVESDELQKRRESHAMALNLLKHLGEKARRYLHREKLRKKRIARASNDSEL